MLKIDHVTKRFGSFTAVNDLTLEIPDKQMFGLLGANGAGKTTTFRMILGLLNATEGTVTWKGQPINYGVTNSIGYLPEERGLYPKLKVKDQARVPRTPERHDQTKCAQGNGEVARTLPYYRIRRQKG